MYMLIDTYSIFQLETDDVGYIKLIKNTMTSIPGIFACGDCADKRYK